MKKYTLRIIAFAAFIAIVVGGFGLFALNAQKEKIASEKQKIDREISLKLDEREIKMPYEKLGISVDITKTGNESVTSSNFGLASLFSIGNKRQTQLKPDISINTKLLAHAVVSIFPFLDLPEDAHASFFITSADQKIKPTFNLRKLVAQLKDEVNDLRKSAVEIEVIPKNLEAKKRELTGKEIILKLEGDDVPTLEWRISADIALDEARLEEFFQNQIVPKVNRPVKDTTIRQFTDEGKAVRVEADGLAQNGISIPIEENMKAIRDAVLTGVLEVFLRPQVETSYVYNGTDIDLGEMQLLAVGRSNFAGSPEGRIFNIQKGLREKMNNIIIPPGAEFSFNSFLGPITAAKGWKKALGIFGGKNLIPTLGGGLCQVSTTVYRAVLLAGLPIVERKAHSLYVNYYKEFGEGLDATIFSTGPDLIFLNDTPSYIFIQSYTDGDEAYVKIFGTSDGRKTTLEGPYRSHNIPAEKGYKPPVNEIVWFRTIKRLDGEKWEEMITSRYRALPRHPS